jgi:uncharacterized RDD family membrane protein YckC
MDVLLDNNLEEESFKDVEYGKLGKRLGAVLIDSFILILVSIICSVLIALKLMHFDIVSFVTVLYLGYFLFMETRYGAAIGKQVMKLRVVEEGTKKAGFKAILIRNSPGIVYIH